MKVTLTPIKGEQAARRRHVQMAYYRQARHFEIAADILKISKNSHSLPKEFKTDIPWVTNHSLAVELYLKCLLQIEDKLAKGHHLGELFYALTPQHQTRIQNHYAKALPSKHGGDVSEILTRTDDAFIEWRYLNEEKPKNSCNIYDATLVLPHIRHVIWEDVPELKNILLL